LVVTAVPLKVSVIVSVERLVAPDEAAGVKLVS